MNKPITKNRNDNIAIISRLINHQSGWMLFYPAVTPWFARDSFVTILTAMPSVAPEQVYDGNTTVIVVMVPDPLFVKT